MSAKIIPFARPAERAMTLDEIFAELGVPFDPLPRVGDVDHWAGYRAKRAELNRAAFKVVS